jgi:hypothetical protein
MWSTPPDHRPTVRAFPAHLNGISGMPIPSSFRNAPSVTVGERGIVYTKEHDVTSHDLSSASGHIGVALVQKL